MAPELKRVPKTLRQIADSLSAQERELLPLLSRLAELQLVKRGFHAHCPNCGTKTWHPLYNLNEKLTCPGCFFTFLLPVEYPKGTELAWEYTLNTLVNRVMDQDALAHVLALHHLSEKGGSRGYAGCGIVPVRC